MSSRIIYIIESRLVCSGRTRIKGSKFIRILGNGFLGFTGIAQSCEAFGKQLRHLLP